MTDKEIIIDGVNVAECMHFDKVSYSFGNTYYCMCDGNMSDICQENSNCYYKQLKRKEQECEEWKNKLAKSFADERKNDVFQRFAAYTSCGFVKELLENVLTYTGD